MYGTLTKLYFFLLNNLHEIKVCFTQLVIKKAAYRGFLVLACVLLNNLSYTVVIIIGNKYISLRV
jgi:hypothetical protein